MSPTLHAVKHWIKLLLDVHISAKQARLLLKTASPRQVWALKEILYNIPNNIDILKLKSKKQKTIIRKLIRLSKKKIVRASDIHRYAVPILKILHAFRDLILSILKNHE
jgi:hypothetical protein